MTDPIRAALDKAVMQRCAMVNDRCHCQDTGSLNRVACADAVHGMAEDCAAFLQALPKGYVEVPSRHGGNRQLGMNHLHVGLLADAVLAAAKEERE